MIIYSLKKSDSRVNNDYVYHCVYLNKLMYFRYLMINPMNRVSLCTLNAKPMNKLYWIVWIIIDLIIEKLIGRAKWQFLIVYMKKNEDFL